MTITQLVTQAQAGSRAAFGELYESLAGDLYRMALYTLGSGPDAEDAVADTFAEAWKGIKNLREPEAFRSWMFRILSARCKRQVAQIVARKKEIDLDSYYETAEEAAPEKPPKTPEMCGRVPFPTSPPPIATGIKKPPGTAALSPSPPPKCAKS